MESLAKNLKNLRKGKGLSQEDLAQKLCVTRQTVSGWETGRCQPDVEMLKALADALETDMNELIYGTKQRAYPRYQRKYILLCIVSGIVAVVYFVISAFYLDAVREYRNQHYKLFDLYFFLLYGFPSIGNFATGVLIPAAYSLVHPVFISRKWRIHCLGVGIVIVVPAFLVIIGTAVGWYPEIVNAMVWQLFYPAGRAIIIRALPFLSGVLLFLSCNKIRNAC